MLSRNSTQLFACRWEWGHLQGGVASEVFVRQDFLLLLGGQCEECCILSKHVFDELLTDAVLLDYRFRLL